MNMEFVNLGKELISQVSNTWSSLEYLNEKLIKNELFEKLGEQVYSNKEIFNDYLYYKYELYNYYNDNNIEMPKGGWFCEWWFDERGKSFQRETFPMLVDMIIELILSDLGGWYYDENGDYYLPKGIHYNKEKNRLAYDFNDEIGFDF